MERFDGLRNFGGGDLRLSTKVFRGFKSKKICYNSNVCHYNYSGEFMKKIFGFTLAEVLITLGIIGVVAALTIPTLMANYQKQVWINKLKKTYSVLNEGYKQIYANEGCTDMTCTSFLGNGLFLDLGNEEAKNKFVSTFKLSNVNNSNLLNYKVNTGGGNTGYTFYDFLGFPVTLSGTTADGSIIAFISAFVFGGAVLVDTNGLRGPNEVGRDIFVFAYTGKMITPFYSRAHYDWLGEFGVGGVSEDDRKRVVQQYCNDNTRLSCAEKIIMDGWQMNY